MDLTTSKILTRDEIYQTLIVAITEKRPLPPAEWNLVKLDEEIRTATAQYEPNPFLRQADALCTAVYYFIDFAVRMPEWIDITVQNERVKRTCHELAKEIVKITKRPDEVIQERSKLKSWLKATLAVNTSLIYVEETEKAIVRDQAAKRLRQSSPKNELLLAFQGEQQKQQSVLAKNIWLKAQNKLCNECSKLPSLF